MPLMWRLKIDMFRGDIQSTRPEGADPAGLAGGTDADGMVGCGGVVGGLAAGDVDGATMGFAGSLPQMSCRLCHSAGESSGSV